MNDDNSLAAKILKQLEEVIFSNVMEIRQFTIIPAEHDLNKSPVVVAEDCVALESWCVKHIFKSVYDDLLSTRHLFLARRLTDKQLKTVNRFLTGALLINPNIVTFWNMKRELVEMGRVPITDELHFSKLALTSSPKSNEIFSYRRWLLLNRISRPARTCTDFIQSSSSNNCLNKSSSSNKSIDSIAMPSETNGQYFDLLLSELLINEYVVKKVPNNYHAFNHRIWLIEKLLPLLGGQLTAKALDLEFKYSTQWIAANISHHTGYAYRQFLIRTTKSVAVALQFPQDFMRELFSLKNGFLTDGTNFLTDAKLDLDLLKCEFKKDSQNNNNYLSCLLYDLYRLTADLAIFRNENESLWYHRRFLLHSLLTHLRQRYESAIAAEEGLKEAKMFKSDLESSVLYKFVKDKEVAFVKANLGVACSAVQKYWTERHCKWLRNVLAVDWINLFEF